MTLFNFSLYLIMKLFNFIIGGGPKSDSKNFDSENKVFGKPVSPEKTKNSKYDNKDGTKTGCKEKGLDEYNIKNESTGKLSKKTKENRFDEGKDLRLTKDYKNDENFKKKLIDTYKEEIKHWKQNEGEDIKKGTLSKQILKDSYRQKYVFNDKGMSEGKPFISVNKSGEEFELTNIQKSFSEHYNDFFKGDEDAGQFISSIANQKMSTIFDHVCGQCSKEEQTGFNIPDPRPGAKSNEPVWKFPESGGGDPDKNYEESCTIIKKVDQDIYIIENTHILGGSELYKMNWDNGGKDFLTVGEASYSEKKVILQFDFSKKDEAGMPEMTILEAKTDIHIVPLSKNEVSLIETDGDEFDIIEMGETSKESKTKEDLKKEASGFINRGAIGKALEKLMFSGLSEAKAIEAMIDECSQNGKMGVLKKFLIKKLEKNPKNADEIRQLLIDKVDNACGSMDPDCVQLNNAMSLIEASGLYAEKSKFGSNVFNRKEALLYIIQMAQINGKNLEIGQSLIKSNLFFELKLDDCKKLIGFYRQLHKIGNTKNAYALDLAVAILARYAGANLNIKQEAAVQEIVKLVEFFGDARNVVLAEIFKNCLQNTSKTAFYELIKSLKHNEELLELYKKE